MCVNMTQIGQSLANLRDFEQHFNNPQISKVGYTGQYGDVLNPPTRVGQFTNDKNYTVAGSNVSQFNNDKQYIVTGSSNNQLTNDSNYAVRGEGVSEFVNDKGYSTISQIGDPVGAIFSGPSVLFGQASSRYGKYSIDSTNIGLAFFASGVDSKSTDLTINHGLPVAGEYQTYVGRANAYCVDSGMDAGIIATIVSVNTTFFKVKCLQFNNTGGTSTHAANDMSISWEMSLVNFGYRNQFNNPYPGAPPNNRPLSDPNYATYARA